MSGAELMTRKRVAIGDLRPGMYVVGLDRSWLQTPFLFHRKLIQRPEEIEKLKKHGIREVEIDTARGSDVSEVADGLVSDIAAPVSLDGSADLTNSSNIVAPLPRAATGSALQPMARELEIAQSIHKEALTVAQKIFEGVGGGSPVDGETVGRVVTSLQDSITRSPEANLLLMQMRRFQKDLFTHAVNVCVLSLVVASIEGLGDDMRTIGLGALLHDIGETRLPLSLLHKTSHFTEAEAHLLKQHPVIGAALLTQSKKIPAPVERIILDHHECIDGSGYPRGARGADLGVDSQLVSLADSYDDMLSGRNQTALQPTEVLRQLYIQANVGAFDRELIEKVIRSLGVYPIGSVVELNTGERAVVISTNRSSALKPTVRIIMSHNGMVQFNGPVITLADRAEDGVERRIIAVVDPIKERIDPMVFLRIGPGALG